MPKQRNCRVCGDAVITGAPGDTDQENDGDQQNDAPQVTPVEDEKVKEKKEAKRRARIINDWTLRGVQQEIKAMILEFIKENPDYETFLTPNPVAEDFAKYLMNDHLEIQNDDILTMYDMMAGTGTESEAFFKLGSKNVTIYMGDVDPVAINFLLQRLTIQPDEKNNNNPKRLEIMKLGEAIREKSQLDVNKIAQSAGGNILRIFDYPEGNNVKQVHIIHLDPEWPGDIKTFQNPDVRTQGYMIIGEGTKVLFTSFAQHLFKNIPALKVVTVKVAKYILSEQEGMINNQLIAEESSKSDIDDVYTKGIIASMDSLPELNYEVYQPEARTPVPKDSRSLKVAQDTESIQNVDGKEVLGKSYSQGNGLIRYLLITRSG